MYNRDPAVFRRHHLPDRVCWLPGRGDGEQAAVTHLLPGAGHHIPAAARGRHPRHRAENRGQDHRERPTVHEVLWAYNLIL